MTVLSFGSAKETIGADSVLAVLAAAMGPGPVPAQGRIVAAPYARSPEDGLALLGAFVAIEDPNVRQAILDAVLTIAARS